jgi:predicted O-methyltransferase YrrM
MSGVKSLIKKIPGTQLIYHNLIYRSFLKLFYGRNYRFLYFEPPGHFYSPIPDIKEVLARWGSLFKRESKDCPGIDLSERNQLELLENLSMFYNDLPFPEAPSNSTRYYYQNQNFRYGDVIILYSFLRHYKPRKVIEVGSGFSSAAMLDTNSFFLKERVHFTFIEPYPDLLFSLLSEEDIRKHIVIQRPLQDVPLELFKNLSEGDVLFIDSSHVVKAGSDVAYIFFYILPELNPGVIIHLHDILWPFEYPKKWLLGGRAWNEAYFLRAFLQFNTTFEIMYFNSFMVEFHGDIIQEKMPLCLKDSGYSIWIRKLI